MGLHRKEENMTFAMDECAQFQDLPQGLYKIVKHEKFELMTREGHYYLLKGGHLYFIPDILHDPNCQCHLPHIID